MITSFTGKHRFLSNFFEEKDGYTNEHHFQAEKTLILKEKIWIYSADTPGEAKKRGRKVTLRDDWDGYYDVTAMRSTCLRKFLDEDLARLLIDTTPHHLIEGNSWGDRKWGCVREGKEWVGENLLGRGLMTLRTELTTVL